MESMNEHKCECCGDCVYLDLNDTMVPIASLGEPLKLKYYCKLVNNYVSKEWICENRFDKKISIVSNEEVRMSTENKNGIARTRTNKSNVNNQ